MNKASRKTIANFLTEFSNDLNVIQTRIVALHDKHAEVAADLAILDAIAGKSHLTYWISAGRGWDDSLYARVNGTIRLDVASFKKDRKLLNTLGRALDRAVPEGSDDYVSEYRAERTYRFRLPNGGFLDIEARLKGDGSKSCRKVQTGVEIKEVPTFAIECA